MIHIAIIGAGQIGSRHLQSLASLDDDCYIQLVDPSQEALQQSLSRFKEVQLTHPGKKNITSHYSVAELRDPIDVAIISTSADVRKKVIADLLDQKKVKHLIIEKILFQTLRDYDDIDSLLKLKGVRAWVNCYMRATAVFKDIKHQLNPEEEINIFVDGSQWFMATTSIHFIDLFAFMTQARELRYMNVKIEKDFIDAKRAGFKEFFGQMTVKNEKGEILKLACQREGKEPNTLRIKNGKKEVIVTFLGYDLHIKINDGQTITEKRIQRPLQSQLTRDFVSQILKEKRCELIDYHQAMPIHRGYIQAILEQMQKYSEKRIEICPIT